MQIKSEKSANFFKFVLLCDAFIVELTSLMKKSFARKMYTAKQIVPFWLRIPYGFTQFFAAKPGYMASAM